MPKKKFDTTAYIVIALGGSILVPHKINTRVVVQLRRILKKILKMQSTRFIIVVGGGKISRTYQATAKKLNHRITQSQLDEIGIAATYLNASLIKNAFGNARKGAIINSEKKFTRITSPITVVSGWTPGRSTDAVAIRMAKKLRVTTIIIIGKPGYVYDKDFTRFKNARHFTHISWSAYRKLIPAVWSPGLPSPVDPIAAQEAQRADINAIVVSGYNMKNVEALLNGKRFKGTVISNTD